MILLVSHLIVSHYKIYSAHLYSMSQMFCSYDSSDRQTVSSASRRRLVIGNISKSIILTLHKLATAAVFVIQHDAIAKQGTCYSVHLSRHIRGVVDYVKMAINIPIKLFHLV